jgi:predicted kinase
MLIIFSGLSGVGKTSIARALATAAGAVHLRIDSIEQALRACGWTVEGEGYAVGYAVAEDNLRLGRIVIADSVNPWPMTRDAWRAVATRAGVRAVEIEIVCSDTEIHRHRVDTRVSDVPGLTLPAWSDVRARDYRPWNRQRLIIDTARLGVIESVQAILTATRTE